MEMSIQSSTAQLISSRFAKIDSNLSVSLSAEGPSRALAGEIYRYVTMNYWNSSGKLYSPKAELSRLLDHVYLVKVL